MINEEQFINPYTLNIFCDASMKGHEGCYGAIADCEYQKVDDLYRIDTNTTNNNAEIKAIRNGIDLAYKWNNNFKNINIFSDSQIAIFGIRDRIFNWKIRNENELYGPNNNKIQSQSIFIEIMQIIVCHHIHVNFYHQKSHVNTSSFKAISSAEHVFKSSNKIRDNVDFNFIKYISILNNKVDRLSREILRNRNESIKKCDGLIFKPDGSFEKEKILYNELIH